MLVFNEIRYNSRQPADHFKRFSQQQRLARNLVRIQQKQLVLCENSLLLPLKLFVLRTPIKQKTQDTFKCFQQTSLLILLVFSRQYPTRDLRPSPWGRPHTSHGFHASQKVTTSMTRNRRKASNSASFDSLNLAFMGIRYISWYFFQAGKSPDSNA